MLFSPFVFVDFLTCSYLCKLYVTYFSFVSGMIKKLDPTRPFSSEISNDEISCSLRQNTSFFYQEAKTE